MQTSTKHTLQRRRRIFGVTNKAETQPLSFLCTYHRRIIVVSAYKHMATPTNILFLPQELRYPTRLTDSLTCRVCGTALHRS